MLSHCMYKSFRCVDMISFLLSAPALKISKLDLKHPRKTKAKTLNVLDAELHLGALVHPRLSKVAWREAQCQRGFPGCMEQLAWEQLLTLEWGAAGEQSHQKHSNTLQLKM